MMFPYYFDCYLRARSVFEASLPRPGLIIALTPLNNNSYKPPLLFRLIYYRNTPSMTMWNLLKSAGIY